MEEPTSAPRIGELEGRHLGPYEIVGLIGRGGMAVVYKALQPNLRRYVAIKVLPGYFVHEEGFLARFRQEAETVARLEHPNILPIYDYGQEGDIPFIVMPLLTGGTLRDWLSNPVPLETALQAFSRILSALEYAHTRTPAIVHRDIKPSNILIGANDWPLLSDFGIAKIVEPSMAMTRSGVMVGTPEYMAPEQSEGRGVDHRADIYAMGIMLYEMLTGRLPFQGQTPVAIILQHLKDEPPSPRTFNESLSPVWDEVIKCALAKAPQDRYPTAAAMDEAIQAAWRRVQLESGTWPTAAPLDPAQLYDSAAQALAQGDWQRVISLCGQILEVDPAHPEAVHLLTQAHEALRRRRSEQQDQSAQDLLRQGDEALAREHFTAARRYYSDALQVDASLAEAESGLVRVEEALGLSQLYFEARADITTEHWEEAASKLATLSARAPSYRDVAALQAEVTRQRERALLGDTADPPTVPRPVVTPSPSADPTNSQIDTGIRPAPSLAADPPTVQADANRRATPAPVPVAAPELPARVDDSAALPPTVAPAARATPTPADSAAAATLWRPRAGEAEHAKRGIPALKLLLPAGLAALAVIAFVAFQQMQSAARVDAPPATSVAVVSTPSAPPPAPTAAGPSAADLFPACVSAAAASDWDGAIAACEEVRQKDAALPGLAAMLASAYVGQGKQQLASGAALGAAAESFDKALAVKPDDAEADQQGQWLRLYQDADAALAAENWSMATEKFEQLYTVAPEYLAGAGDKGVKPKLHSAQVGWGQALLDAGQFAEAQQRCQQALSLLADSAEAQSCRATALAALATPTPRPAAPAPAIAPTPRPAGPVAAPTARPAAPPVAAPVNPPPAAPAAQPAVPTRPAGGGVAPPPTRPPG